MTPGWYQDPWNPGSVRWFDGHRWTPHTYAATTPILPAVQVTQVHVAHAAPRSAGVAVLLAFLFGPLGMLYSTVAGGLVMLVVDLVLGPLTLGLWFLLAWPLQMIWAGVAATQSDVAATTAITTVAQPAPVLPTWNATPVYGAVPPAQPSDHPRWDDTLVGIDIVDAEIVEDHSDI